MSLVADQAQTDFFAHRVPAVLPALARVAGVIAVVAAGAASTFVSFDAAHAGSKKAVLELFTSQGCSSCPPADALIEKLAQKQDILALSFSVDYWDYLGWKDTFALHENTVRQQAYASGRGDRSVYTPQVVINGREAAVGSNQRAIMRSVKQQTRLHGGLPVDVDLKRKSDGIEVKLGALEGEQGNAQAKIWLVLYDKTGTVKIRRGENRGSTITYTNVVRGMVPIGEWTGEAKTLQINRAAMKAKADYDHCAILVQRFDGPYPSEIIGASDPLPIDGNHQG